MLIRVAPLRAVYRHSQDTFTSCGRACVQMIVSSLTQGPSPGTAPTPAEQALPVPTTQAQVQAMEAFPLDDLTQPSWYTHPDELRDVLRSHPALRPPNPDYSNWRIGSHASFADMIADVYETLKAGMPAIINIRTADHWVVVASVDESGGAVTALQLLDPVYSVFNPGSAGHTYMDNCGLGSDGVTWWQPWDISRANLAGLEVAIGNVPPPAGLTNYQGRFVTVGYGAARPSPQIARRTELYRRRRPVQKAKTRLDRIIEELRRFANEFAVAKLQALLDPPPVPLTRTVKDIDSQWAPYTLASLFREDLEYGLVAAFGQPHDELMHFRFTSSRQLVDSLDGDPAEPLWWTRRFLPALQSPYFPFRRTAHAGQPVYRRALDGEIVMLPASPD
ncbi:MAG: hypothetical protein AB1635_11660 [Acidobacteriota bacterium]